MISYICNGINNLCYIRRRFRRWPTTKIVFMSGYAENVIVRDGPFNSGTLLLSKPFHKKDLAQIVRQALDGPAGL